MTLSDAVHRPESTGVDKESGSRERTKDKTDERPSHHPRLHEPTSPQHHRNHSHNMSTTQLNELHTRALVSFVLFLSNLCALATSLLFV